MKKILLVLPLVALFLLSACSSSDDDVAVNYNVTVKLTAGDDIVLASVKDLSVTAVNLATSSEQTASPLDGQVVFSLPTGKYDFRVTGQYQEQGVNAFASGVSIAAEQTVDLVVKYAAANSTLIFKEMYFTGVPSYYFKDGFYEIYNNSDEVQYLDGVILGIVDEGLPNYSSAPSVWVDDNGNLLDRYPMANFTMYFPGNGTDYPLNPGKSVVVAPNPIDHSSRTLGTNDKKSPVDLSKADWDIYCGPYSSMDVDVANIPNLEYAYHTYGIDFMLATSGQAIILAKLPEGMKVADFVANQDNFMVVPGKTQKHLMIPSDYVIDGVDIVPAPVNERFKNLLPKTDIGMAWVDGSNDGSFATAAYSGKSLRRKVESVVGGITKYRDTNNSSIDFILGGGTPTPGIIQTKVD